jgi:trans-2,3-dihydro-3-hydroxyanthranilate isomerase
MRVPFRLVDVFAERPLTGNQLCVIPEPVDLDAAAMQALAREIGFSETTFVTEASGDRYAMRIFTPDQELPFAGHPTIGTAFVMVSEGRVTSPLTQVVAAGEIPVVVDLERGYARMRQPPPVFDDEFPDPEGIAVSAGLSVDDLHEQLPPQVVSTGLRHLQAPVRDLDALRRAVRNPERLAKLAVDHRLDALYLFALTDEGATARMFDPAMGIGEDPATGSAAGPLGAYLAAHGAGGMPGRIVVHQGEQVGRPSRLDVEVTDEGDPWRVMVGGGVFVVGRGAFEF